MLSDSAQRLVRSLARVWLTVGLGMLVSYFGIWELGALLESPFLFYLFGALFYICPAIGLAWSGVLVYRARRGSFGARAV